MLLTKPCVCVCLFICLPPVCISICLPPVCISICLPIGVSISIYPSVCLPTRTDKRTLIVKAINRCLIPSSCAICCHAYKQSSPHIHYGQLSSAVTVPVDSRPASSPVQNCTKIICVCVHVCDSVTTGL